MHEQELFGPLSMRALEEDKYVRQIDGYLPSARVAFIDEIFKANSAILNTLLTILNERLFDNGSSRVRVPLVCLVSIVPPPPLSPGFLKPLQPCCVLSQVVLYRLPNSGGWVVQYAVLCMVAHRATCDCLLLGTCRWAPQTSCQRARSWTRCTTAS